MTDIEKQLIVLCLLPYHPNIGRYLHYEIKNNNLRLFFPKYDISLQNYIKNKKTKFTRLEILYLCKKIIKALNYLHYRKIVHYTLWPEYIFLVFNQSNLPQVIIQKMAWKNLKNYIEKKGRNASYMTSKFIYCAPEILLNITTNESDIWSFGMVLYELITLKSPYISENISFVDIMKNIQHGNRPQIDDVKGYEDIVAIYENCTVLNPSERITAKEIKNKIKPMVQDIELSEINFMQ